MFIFPIFTKYIKQYVPILVPLGVFSAFKMEAMFLKDAIGKKNEILLIEQDFVGDKVGETT
jgi:hypothetical protein